ncbi:MAG: ABC transporter ATP-binding protein [Acidobacteriaceae bacterium]|nr:ABC transporter ATP-binding protein [Acidobacteriaceae bacterium]
MELRIEGLSKTYPNGVKALDNVSLHIPPGMYGLLGPNGAGKSTLMRILATLQEPDSGSAFLGNIDILRQKDEVRRILGYLPQDFGVYPRMTAQEMFDQIALLKGVSHARERKELVDWMLHRVNLYEHREKALSSFSGGMRQRFGIGQALLGKPQLLIVDEPTAGLDPGERNRFYNLLAEIGENVVVILSTHIVQDVMELCTNMAIIHKGQVLFSGSPEHSVESLQGMIWERFVPKAEYSNYAQNYKVISSKLTAGRPLIHVYSTEPPGDGFQLVKPDLEDVFFTKISGLS